MGKVIPIRVHGKHIEKSDGLRASATEYLAQELAEIIEEMSGFPDAYFHVEIQAKGYPPELLERIKSLLEA